MPHAERLTAPTETAFKGMTEFSFNGDQTGVDEFTRGDDNHVESWRDLVKSEDLSNQSFSSVSRNRTSELPGRGDSQPANRQIVCQGEEREVLTVNSDAALIDALIVHPATNALDSGETGHC